MELSFQFHDSTVIIVWVPLGFVLARRLQLLFSRCFGAKHKNE